MGEPSADHGLRGQAKEKQQQKSNNNKRKKKKRKEGKEKKKTATQKTCVFTAPDAHSAYM